MAERAQELAECFAQANAHFMAFVEQIPDDHWDQPLSAEDVRSAAIVARHVAYGNAFQQRYFHAIAVGRPLLDVDLPQIETLIAELPGTGSVCGKRKCSLSCSGLARR